MSDPWPGINISDFEYVVTSPSKTLLRVSAKGPRRHDAGNRPILIVDDGQREQRFSPLASPPDRGRTLRAAYAVPPELMQSARAYWLEHDSGARMNLPVPEPGLTRITQEPEEPDSEIGSAHEPEPGLAREVAERLETQAVALQATRRASEAEAQAAEAQARATAAEGRVQALTQQLADAHANVDSLSGRLTEADRDAQAVRLQLADTQRQVEEAVEARQPLEEALAEERSARINLKREHDHVRDQLRLMTLERDELSRQATAFDDIAVKARERAQQAEDAHEKSSAALREIEIWRAELERRLSATTSELGAAKAAHEADERELGRLRAALAEYESHGAGARSPSGE